MKQRWLAGFLAGCLLLSAGCGQRAEGPEASPAAVPGTEEASGTETVTDTEPEGTEVSYAADPASDILVVYFSRTGEQYSVGVIDKGNTEIVAEMIAEQTGADLFQILPEEGHYPETYDELADLAKQEQTEEVRPQIINEVPDLAPYDTIFIGSPVWWGNWPMILYTFFEENQEALAGKTLIPFSTHAGSGLSGFDEKLAADCPDSTVGKGFSVEGAKAQNDPEAVRAEVKEWLTELGFE